MLNNSSLFIHYVNTSRNRILADKYTDRQQKATYNKDGYGVHVYKKVYTQTHTHTHKIYTYECARIEYKQVQSYTKRDIKIRYRHREDDGIYSMIKEIKKKNR